jgi:hypothetical protein
MSRWSPQDTIPDIQFLNAYKFPSFMPSSTFFSLAHLFFQKRINQCPRGLINRRARGKGRANQTNFSSPPSHRFHD